MPRAVSFLGNTLETIRAFPDAVRRDIGFQIDRVQRGLDPNDWKPLKAIGSGVREIRVRDRTGAFRVIYVASFSDAVFVLHAFQKKTQATAKHDIDLARVRFRLLAQRSKA
jgi:phage-related protein